MVAETAFVEPLKVSPVLESTWISASVAKVTVPVIVCEPPVVRNAPTSAPDSVTPSPDKEMASPIESAVAEEIVSVASADTVVPESVVPRPVAVRMIVVPAPSDVEPA